jgi:xanthine dehydrogenase YagR molybdenum-binding subunit
MKDPVTGRPYSSRSLIECLQQGAEAFGWRDRSAAPGAMRNGEWLVGWGCAMACYPAQISPAAARVRLTPDGAARVSIAAHEIGDGAYTVIAQAAAERLGLSPDKITVNLADSILPAGPVAGGSNTTASTTTVVVKACDAMRDRLFRAAASAATARWPVKPVRTLRLRTERSRRVMRRCRSLTPSLTSARA